MNQLTKVFDNHELRIIEKDGEAWFVGKDVADILDYKEAHKAIVRHTDEEDRIKHPIQTKGGTQDSWIVNESGLYSLILS